MLQRARPVSHATRPETEAEGALLRCCSWSVGPPSGYWPGTEGVMCGSSRFNEPSSILPETSQDEHRRLTLSMRQLVPGLRLSRAPRPGTHNRRAATLSPPWQRYVTSAVASRPSATAAATRWSLPSGVSIPTCRRFGSTRAGRTGAFTSAPAASRRARSPRRPEGSRAPVGVVWPAACRPGALSASLSGVECPRPQ